jgi:hypothetical protein
LRASGPIDLAIMSIGAYNPWILSPCTPEQAVQMANEAGAHFAITFCRCITFRRAIAPARAAALGTMRLLANSGPR